VDGKVEWDLAFVVALNRIMRHHVNQRRNDIFVGLTQQSSSVERGATFIVIDKVQGFALQDRRDQWAFPGGDCLEQQ
jgi:hypothetical protein